MKILVLGGADSPEREVSIRSAASVREALTGLGHEVGYFDPLGRMNELAEAAREYELVMPILHGIGGEDGQVQRVLGESGVPYLGADAAASELCFDKVRLKELLRQNNILTPAGEVVTRQTFARPALIQAPFVLKPVADGSSVGMMIARKLPFDAALADKLLTTHDTMLLEELIEGIEITVPVLGDKALPVIEIVPPDGEEFDYKNKYNGATAEICPPENVGAEAQIRAQELAEKIHALAGVRHLSRTDMILRADGQIYVLEINTMPGMTGQSLLPKSAAVAGYSWPQLVAKFVELAAGKETTTHGPHL